MQYPKRSQGYSDNKSHNQDYSHNNSSNHSNSPKPSSNPTKPRFKKSLKLNQVRTITRANRDLLVNINMFLLTNAELKGLFWSVKSVDYNPQLKTLKISIDTIDNKLGTTLEKMRKIARFLGEDMYQKGLLSITPRVYFSVQKEDTLMDKLAKIEFETQLFDQITKNTVNKDKVDLLSL